MLPCAAMKPDDTARQEAVFHIWKEFSFEAAHCLTKVPPDHPCARLHGHSYRVRLHCAGRLDPARDWVTDFGDIAAAAQPVIAQLDHRVLNEVMDIETTAENLAWWLARALRPQIPSLCAVEVFETAGTCARLDL